MRAIVTRLRPDGRRENVVVDDWPEPDAPVGNQVRMETVFTGITNGTERNNLIGGNYAARDELLPTSVGYQNVGRIVEAGPDVAMFGVGDLVYSGISPHVASVVTPEDVLLVRIPDDVDPTHAALLGMTSVAMHTCRNADPRVGETVLIAGAGYIGQVAAQIVTAMGATATIVDLDERRLAQAREIDPRIETLRITTADWSDVVGNREFDAVLDFAGAVGYEDRLLSAARHGGRVLFIAGRWRVDYDFMIVQHKELTIKQNSHFTQDDLEITVCFIREGRIRIGPLIQDVVPVSEAPRIYDALRDAPATLFGTVFDWAS